MCTCTFVVKTPIFVIFPSTYTTKLVNVTFNLLFCGSSMHLRVAIVANCTNHFHISMVKSSIVSYTYVYSVEMESVSGTGQLEN